jgi:phosphate transport system substrate-binding protein
MKKAFLLAAAAAVIALAGCEKPEGVKKNYSGVIPGLTLDNFPVMDGSTSTDPLVRTIACELMGYDYKWEQPRGATWNIATYLPETFVDKKIRCSQTHNALMSIASGMAISDTAPPDIVFSARKMSADERQRAKDAGVELIETPIALDALVFIAHDGVSVNSLSKAQLESIYTAKTKNWNEVGGGDMPIKALVRNKNSGSQELMESLVMSEPIPDGFYEEQYEDFQQVSAMYPLLTGVGTTPGGLGYTVYYYLENIVRGSTLDHLKTLAVDGVAPNKATIANRSYPFTAEVYMVVRADLDKGAPAYKVYEFLQSRAGRDIIARSGYVPVH